MPANHRRDPRRIAAFPVVVRPAILLTALALFLVWMAPRASEAQTRTSRLDRVFHGLTYRSLDPGVRGAATVLAGHEQGHGALYMGTEDAGLWGSEDGGITWRPVSDGWLPAGSVGAAAVAPSDPAVVYVGTGHGGLGPEVAPGRGVFRSLDGGETWEGAGLESVPLVGGIAVHPTDPRTVFVAAVGDLHGDGTDRGVYRSRGGGATWERVLFVDEGLGALDVALDPRDPDVLHAALWAVHPVAESGVAGSADGAARSGSAAEAGIHRSTDGGATWRRVTAGLPDAPGRIDLAVGGGGAVTYALVEASDDQAGLYRSADGVSWRRVHALEDAFGDGARFPRLHAHPVDPDRVWVVGAGGVWGSGNGGERFEVVDVPAADPRAVWAHGADAEALVLASTAGVALTRDGGASWVLEEGRPAAPPADPEGGAGVVSPHDPAIRYRVDEAYVLRSLDGGADWDRVSPELVEDGARAPDGTPAVLTAVEESPLEPGLLWAAGSDGRLHLTRDGGGSWRQVALPSAASSGRLSDVDVSAHVGGRAHLAVDRGGLGDPRPFVFRTEDYGATWSLLTGEGSGMPVDHRTPSVLEDPERSGLLFAGTTFGLFVSFDDGESWDLFQFDLPASPVTGLRMVGQDLVLSTAGRGRFVMYDVTPLRQVMQGLAAGEPYLFEPAPTYLDGTDGATAPRRSAIFDYLLPSFVRRVRLEVLDADGAVLKTFFSGEPTSRLGGRNAPTPEERAVLPGTRSGVHRIVWDLMPDEGAPGAGMAVGPGLYRLRMTVDGLERIRDFELVAGPPPMGTVMEDTEAGGRVSGP